MNLIKIFMFAVTLSLLSGCSDTGKDDNGAAAVSGTENNAKYTLCECVNEPIRSGEKAEACGKLAETVPDYVSKVMACKGETVPGIQP